MKFSFSVDETYCIYVFSNNYKTLEYICLKGLIIETVYLTFLVRLISKIFGLYFFRKIKIIYQISIMITSLGDIMIVV